MLSLLEQNKAIPLKVSGYWLIAISMLHIFGGLIIYTEPLLAIAHDGWFNAVAPDPLHPYFDREDAFWYLMAAPFIFTIGQLCFWAQARQITLPAFLGWTLLVTATVGCFMEPISGGFWFLIPPGFLILTTSRQTSPSITCIAPVDEGQISFGEQGSAGRRTEEYH